MGNEEKRNDLSAASVGTEITTDTTHRARNRTVMLTPEMTGQMRAHMMEDDPVSRDSSHRGEVDWENATPEKFGGRMIGHQAKPEEDNSDWTRPIEPATFSEGDENGEGTTDDFERGWQPGDEIEATPVHPGYGGNGVVAMERHSEVDPYARADNFLGKSEVQATQPRGSIIGATPTYPRSHVPTESHASPVTTKEVSERRESSYDAGGHDEEYRGGYERQDEEAEMQLPERVTWKQETQIVGFLVTFDHNKNGSYIPLRTGRLIVTSESEGNGSVLLINDSSVSPMHAIMRVASGPSVQVLDQLSESGTRIIRFADGQEELLSGEKANLLHGDTVFFGDRKFHVCLIQGVTS